jgi:hypothetical protein
MAKHPPRRAVLKRWHSQTAHGLLTASVMNRARRVECMWTVTMALAIAGCGSITRTDMDARQDAKADRVADRTVPDAALDNFEPTDGVMADVPGGDGPVEAAADRAPDMTVGVDVPVDRPPDAPADMGPPDVRSDGSCVCPRIYRPVCGVDGRTYSNNCEANCAGIAIAHDGACETADAGMTTACTTDSDCVLYPPYVGGCCGACRLKSEPMPPRITCIVACQNPYKSCLCVNKICMPQGGGASI